MGKNVLHVVGLSGYGGLEQLFVAYLGAMSDTPAPPAVVIKQGVHPDFRPRLHAYPGAVHHQKHWGIVRIPNLTAMRRLNLSRILRASAADRVVFWSTLPSTEWIRACRSAGAQIIYYDHGRAWQLTRATAAPLAEADTAITVSEAGHRVLRERLGYAGPIHIVPNGVRFPVSPPRPRTRSDGPLRIGFAGRLVDKKGVPILLWAARALADSGVDFEMLIAGDGPGHAALSGLVTQLDLSNRVRFLGEIRDMPAFYAGTDVIVVPSLQEPFGLTSLEAAAHGVPVVVARVDGLAGTIIEGETGLSLPATLPMATYRRLGGGHYQVPEQVYDPDTGQLREPAIIDPDALAALLGELTGQRERLAEMGEQAARHVQVRFSMDGYVERLNAALAVSDPGRGSSVAP